MVSRTQGHRRSGRSLRRLRRRYGFAFAALMTAVVVGLVVGRMA